MKKSDIHNKRMIRVCYLRINGHRCHWDVLNQNGPLNDTLGLN